MKHEVLLYRMDALSGGLEDTKLSDILDAILEIYHKKDNALMRRFYNSYCYTEDNNTFSLNQNDTLSTFIRERFDRYCLMADIYLRSGDLEKSYEQGCEQYWTAKPESIKSDYEKEYKIHIAKRFVRKPSSEPDHLIGEVRKFFRKATSYEPIRSDLN
jgi:hypothetical protein